ncbi:MAG TPA: sigma-70 family RNA polymerase sigma factor [Rhodoplanes sp.]|nr:sigma-70 family RNA polymerase sigma factor [Rhodoplanes sp.]
MASAVSSRAVTSARAEESLDALLARTASGDQTTFRALYDRTSGRLFAICLRIARNRTLAEDFLQEAYARVWERSPQFDPQRGSALAWMIALTRNHAIDVIRTRGREVLSVDGTEFEVPDQPALAPAEARLDYPAIARALAELDEGPRRAIMHAYLDGMSYQEIGAALGIPIGTAKTWVSRGIAKLRRSLDGGA